jgi:release factor glutamine methyltransferase
VKSVLRKADDALLELGRRLQRTGYGFVTITPESHRRVLSRDARPARDLRDVFGWGRPFAPDLLPPALLDLAIRAEAVEPRGADFQALVRFSSLGDCLFVHSAFPTTAPNAVFFGPDTYRFCAFLRRALIECDRLVDIGCGSGAGGLFASCRARSVVLADVNPLSLRFAEVNAALSGTLVELVESDVLASVAGAYDAIISNPPFLRDAAARTYRDGGGQWGEGLSLRIAHASIERLPPQGRLYLYTGAPVVGGVDRLKQGLLAICREARASLTYEELDPDIFGEELSGPAYTGVDRIAAVTAVVAVRPD